MVNNTIRSKNNTMSDNIKFATETLGKTYDELRPILHTLKKNMISSNLTSDEFMIKFPDLIDWTIACRSVQLSNEVIRQVCNQDGFDWKVAVIIQNIPTDVLEEHMDKVDWEDVQKHQVLSMQFIRNHRDAVNIDLILKSKQYPQETLNLFMSDSNPNSVYNLLKIIVEFQKPTEEFFTQHWDLIDKSLLLKKHKLSSEFIQTHIQDFDINELTLTQELPDDLLIERLSQIQPDILSKVKLPETILLERIATFNCLDVALYQNITPAVYAYLKQQVNTTIDKTLFDNRIKSTKYGPIEDATVRQSIIDTIQNWNEISYGKDLPVEFIKEFHSKLNMRAVVNNTKMTPDDVITLKLNSIERYMWYIQQTDANIKNNYSTYEFWWDDTNSYDIIHKMEQAEQVAFIDLFLKNSNMVQIIKSQQLPVWLLELMVSKIDWYWVCRCQKMSDETVNKFLQYIDPTYLVEYQQLSEEFLVNNKDILMWDLVCKHQMITPRIIKELNSYINIDSLKLNKTMTCVDIDNCLREYNHVNNLTTGANGV